jgi:hypothetical protein
MGELLGIKRKTAMTGISEQAAMKFYLSSPATDPVVIASGTRVWSPADPNKYFSTLFQVTIPTGESATFVSILAPETGSYYTAAPGTLTAHGHTLSSLRCTNLASVAGSDDEDDDAYRYRLAYARFSRNTTTLDAVKVKLLALPGILDLRMLPFRRGAGTLDIVAYTVEPVPSQVFLDQIRDYTQNELVSTGISVDVVAPTPVSVGLVVKVAFRPSTNAGDKPSIRQAATTAIKNHINTRNFGEPMYMGDIEGVVRAISPDVLDVIVTALSVDGARRSPDTVVVGEFSRCVSGSIEVL